MVITINEKVINTIPSTLNDFMSLNPTLHSSNLQFAAGRVTEIDPLFSLYINQGEYAIIDKNDKIKIVGSDDATTCHILIVKSKTYGAVVSHLDGQEKECDLLANCLRDFCSRSGENPKFEAYVIGGYASKEVNINNKCLALSISILKMLSVVEFPIDLRVFCCNFYNTKIISGEPFPLFYGLAIDMQSLTIFPASFCDKLPNHNLRAASHWVRDDSYDKVYDSSSKKICISPFDDWDQSAFLLYASLRDDILLKYFSTSPMVEPPTFCDKLRQVFSLLGNSTAQDLFPDSRPRSYSMQDNGTWVEVFS